MGSASSKSRKPKQQHLPKVGTAQNRAYEARERGNVAWQLSKVWMIAIVVAIILAIVGIWILAT